MITTFDYLIVGAGMAADAAARGIREIGDAGSIAIVSNDLDPPYTRPALSKKLWTDPEFRPEDNCLGTANATGARVMTGTTVVSIVPESHIVVTDDGEQISYGRLLLATGGTPRTVAMPPSERAIYFRSFADYRALRRLSGSGRHIAIVGGSYIGTELAAGLIRNETETTLIYPDETLGGAMFPAPLAQHFEAAFEQRGVHLLPGTRVESGAVNDAGIVLYLSDGSGRWFDGVAFELGIDPCVALAEHAGLQVDDGIVVDQRLHTSSRNIYAAGDVASYPDHILGRRRVEHVNNATRMGAAAGRIMAGSIESYNHTPHHYSDVFDMSWQAVGTLDSSLETFSDWAEPLQSGVVYYLDNGAVVGILLWNVADRLDAARAVLDDWRPQDAATLVGRI